MLKTGAFSLRKDDALSLKELITETQAKASRAGGRFRDQTRVRAFPPDPLSCLSTASARPFRPSEPCASCLIGVAAFSSVCE